MERTSKKGFIIDVLYAVLVFAIVFGVSYAVIKFLLPFVAGVLVALLVQRPACRIAEKTRFSRGGIAAMLSFLLYLVLAAIVCFLAYRIVLSAAGFADYFPRFFEGVSHKLNGLGERYSHVFERIPENMREWLKSFVGETTQNITSSIVRRVTNLVSEIISKMPQFFISGIVTLVASCYIAKDFEHLQRFVKSVIGKAVTARVVKIKNILFGSVFKLLKGYFILALITAAQLYAGFLILGIKRAFTLALLIALVDLLPVLGTGTVIIPWGFTVALLGDYALGVGLGILYVIITLVRNFLEPKIIGSQLGVNALFTLVAMFLGFKMLGVWGLILFPVIFIVTIGYYKQEMSEGLSV